MSEVITSSPSPDVITIDDLARIDTPELDGADLDNSSVPTSNMWFYLKYALIILVLSALGLNLFFAAGNLTESISSVISPLLSKFGIQLGNTVKGTAQTTAEGGKLALDVAAGTVTSATDLLQGTTQAVSNSKQNVENAARSVTNKMGRLASSHQHKRVRPPPSADETTSTTQRGSKGRKGGYCYIGEENGIRSCLRVSDASMCMSGEIFPSKDICINPTLRE